MQMSTQNQQRQTNYKHQSNPTKTSKNHPETYWFMNHDQSPFFDDVIHSSPNQHQHNPKLQPQQQNPNPQPTYLASFRTKTLVSILNNISKQYATFRFFDFSSLKITKQQLQQIFSQIQAEFLKFKLTKRNLVFCILIPPIPIPLQNFISSQPHFTKFIKFYINLAPQTQTQTDSDCTSQPSTPKDSSFPFVLKFSRKFSILIGKFIFLDVRKSPTQIQQEIIKQMKLDFIWLGVVSRLGVDVNKLTETLIETEDFTPEYIGFYEIFFDTLNQLLFLNTIHEQEPNLANSDFKHLTLRQILEASYKKACEQNLKICSITEELIRSRFNSRIILNDIVSAGDYLPLLTSRNYFNLLYIESDTLARWKMFKHQCEFKYPDLTKILDIETFLMIDDYVMFFLIQWYRMCVLKCLPNVKFVIDRGNQEISYKKVISKGNYKQIIPSYRPNFDEYFLSICNVLKQRSGCLKEAVGSIIVKQKRIISTGYNGTPEDCVNCFNGGCKVCNNSQKMNTEVLSCTCIHAEYGCIIEAGIKITPGSTLYSTKMPCLWCCKLIIQGRISKIVCLKSRYPHLEYENIELVKQILANAKIDLVEVDSTKYYISV